MKNITLFSLLIIYLFAFYKCDNWYKEACGGDPLGYYAHLPATFIYEDVGDYSKTFAIIKQYDRNAVDPKADIYGVRQTPAGK